MYKFDLNHKRHSSAVKPKVKKVGDNLETYVKKVFVETGEERTPFVTKNFQIYDHPHY